MRILGEYERRLKNVLEEPDPVRRKVAYYGVALGFVNSVLRTNSTNDSISQLNLILRVEKDKFLNKIVELTIVNSVDLDKAITDIINFKIFTIRPDVEDLNKDSNVAGAFGVSKILSTNVANDIQECGDTFNLAVLMTQFYITETIKPVSQGQEIKLPEDSGIKLTVKGPNDE